MVASYAISIDYVMLRDERDNARIALMPAESVMAPVGRWGQMRVESSGFRRETEKD